MARELRAIELLPHLRGRKRVHSHDELPERRLDQLGDRGVRAPVVCLPQPMMPSSVVTFTTTASRLTAVPMPSATRFCGGTGKEVGYALTAAIFIGA